MSTLLGSKEEEEPQPGVRGTNASEEEARQHSCANLWVNA